MSETDRVFAGSIPEHYDRFMVPMIFEPYAADLARRAALLSPHAVLEIAAGTGAVTRALAPMLSPNARYVVSDLNQPMLNYAALRQTPDDRIEWRQANAISLPFDDSSFDLVCCQFGAMFFPDRVAAYREVKRVLKPAGQFIFNVWDRIDENEFADEVTKALAHLFPDDPPLFLARTPHGLHDTSLIVRELADAGFSQVTVETRAEESRAPSAKLAARAYCEGTPLRMEIEARDPGKLDAAISCSAAAIEQSHGSGQIVGKIQAHVITAAVQAAGLPPPE
ncbi:MAG: methyltransferase domain-containing protein [Beijerinckiaceae bacterium]|nr:methyltransferase domain-containing protein [Beijerinckiaceae bacterium]